MQKQDRDISRPYYYAPPQAQRQTIAKQAAARVQRRLIGSGVCMLLIAVTLLIHSTHTKKSVAQPQPAAKSTTQSQPQAKIAPTTSAETMATTINRIISDNSDVDISVSVIDLKTGKLTHYGAPNSVTFEAASVAKLITACAYLHEVQQGNETLTQSMNGTTAQAALKAMITESDNEAWTALNTELGHPLLLDYATSLGMTNYDPDANTLNSDDVARLEQQLYQGKLLSTANTQLLLSYMAQANRTDFIKAAIPHGVKVYHKAGWLEDRDHDAAIIDDGSHPYVLVILTNGQNNAHLNERATVIQQLTAATVSHFIRDTTAPSSL